MWALLPSDLIIAVAERLPIVDYARFRAVCTAWSSAVKDFHPCTPSSFFPWLYTESTAVGDRPLSFFSCSEGRYYHPSLPANISASGTSVRLIGRRDGWMVLLLDDDLLLPVVVNPLSGTQLPLPSLRTLPCKYRSDISYTIIPYPTRNVAFVIYSFPLHSSQVSSQDSRHGVIGARRMRFNDVVYHNGRFYAVYPSGKMLSFELGLSSSGTMASVVVAENKYLTRSHVNFTRDVFLVSSPSGDLLQVRMLKYSSDLGPHVVRKQWPWGLVTSFLVAKYDTEADGWTEIGDLGDSCIFVDKCQAMLLPAEHNNDRVDDTAWPRLRRNRIYFAGFHYSDHCTRGWDVRVYEVGSIAEGNPCTFQSYHPLFWFRPSLA